MTYDINDGGYFEYIISRYPGSVLLHMYRVSQLKGIGNISTVWLQFAFDLDY